MKFPTSNENDLPHLPYFGSKVSFRIIWKMLKIVKNQWDGYISSLSFSNQVLFCCKPSNLNEICGNTGNAKVFFFLTYETDDSQRGCPHWDQCQVTWEQFLAATYLKMDPPVRLLEWLFWIQLGLSRARALRSWSSSQFTWKPFCCAFNKVLSPCLWLSGKLPFNSSRKKYPSKAIQFL